MIRSLMYTLSFSFFIHVPAIMLSHVSAVALGVTREIPSLCTWSARFTAAQKVTCQDNNPTVAECQWNASIRSSVFDKFSAFGATGQNQ